MRMEDDVLVTDSGYELLSRKLPRDPDEIEKIMAAAANSAPQRKQNNEIREYASCSSPPSTVGLSAPRRLPFFESRDGGSH